MKSYIINDHIAIVEVDRNLSVCPYKVLVDGQCVSVHRTYTTAESYAQCYERVRVALKPDVRIVELEQSFYTIEINRVIVKVCGSFDEAQHVVFMLQSTGRLV